LFGVTHIVILKSGTTTPIFIRAYPGTVGVGRNLPLVIVLLVSLYNIDVLHVLLKVPFRAVISIVLDLAETNRILVKKGLETDLIYSGVLLDS
jgi:hypothetical protein